MSAPISIRVAAERAVLRGDLTEALRDVERAILTAPDEYRADLEEARSWLAEMLPVERHSFVGEA